MTETKKKKKVIPPLIVDSMLWAISDALPKEDPCMVEWGSGGSTLFWLENTEVKELYSIENHEGWYKRIDSQIKAEDLGRVAMHYCPFDQNKVVGQYEAVSDYALGAYAPLDRAHVFLVDGHYRRLCVATISAVARPGAVIFLHDSESPRYQWIHKFMEMHPEWAKCGHWSALPEEKHPKPGLEKAEMTAWTRLG